MDYIILLPDDLLITITSICASGSLKTILSLRLVSKKFKVICADNHVLKHLSLGEQEFHPYCFAAQQFHKQYYKLGSLGNPEALFRLGITCYFYDQRPEEGLTFICDAARKNMKEAVYLYGLMLICFGGELHPIGLKMLSSLIMPLMSQTLRTLDMYRSGLDRYLRPNLYGVCSHLKRCYKKKECNCDGSTTTFTFINNFWRQFGVHEDINTSSICEICLWHHQVKLLLLGYYV